jgi:polysaccharide export outer membrane protein
MRRSIVFFCLAYTCALSPCLQAQVLQSRQRYLLQPGDKLDIKFRLTPEHNEVVTIQPDGYVTLSIAGQVKVVSLSITDAEEEIAKHASKRLNVPEVSIGLVDFEKPYFVVSGEVSKPGKYEMREDTTAMQALLLAGGPLESAKVSQILVFRKINTSEAQVRVLNFKGVKKTADLEHDYELQSGDMLYVTRNKISQASQILRLGSSLGFYLNPFSVVH